jgi:hypothetical protein
MKKIKAKNIKEVCDEIDLIIAGMKDKTDYRNIYWHLEAALSRGADYGDIALICETVVKISKTKNRILRYVEKDIWSFINSIPFQIMLMQAPEINENEELLPNTDYDNISKQILSRLVGLVQEIMGLKDDNSKGSELRRAGSIKLVGELINYYHLPIAKGLFVDSLTSKNIKEQYEALQGLENYYEVENDEIEEELVNILKDIKSKTDDRSVASTCLQVLINAGIMDEMIALTEMDDWKDEHYYD